MVTLAIYHGNDLADVIEVTAHDAQQVARFYSNAGYTARVM